MSTLTTELSKLSERYRAANMAIHGRIEDALVAAGSEQSLAQGIKDAASAGLATKLGTVVDGVKTQMQAQQRDLSRGITPLVRDKMQPAYVAGAAEAGTGSHRRRCTLIENHVSQAAIPMFKAAVAPAVQALSGLRGKVSTQLRSVLVDRAVSDLRTNYTVAWEDASAATVAARAAIRDGVHVAVCEARQALIKLLEVQGAERPVFSAVGDEGAGGGGGGAGDDDDVLEVVVQKKQAAAVEMIEIDDDDDEIVVNKGSAPAASSALSKALDEAVRVKAEKNS